MKLRMKVVSLTICTVTLQMELPMRLKVTQPNTPHVIPNIEPTNPPYEFSTLSST